MKQVIPVLAVESVPASLAFYQEILGFREWFQWEGPSGQVTAGVASGGVRLILDPVQGLSPAEMEHRGTGMELYVEVGEEIDAYYEQVRERAQVVALLAKKPWGDRVFTIQDPDGYRISFYQET